MMKKQNVRTLALIVSTFMYLLIGAAIFDALESKNESEEKARLQNEERIIQERYNITNDDMATLRHVIIKAKPYRAGIQWKFAGAFYFSLSVITTIGYGHSTPRTDGGKVFCILYALIGIPLNIVMFQSIGERFNIGITLVLKKVKKCISLKKCNVTQSELTILAGFLCTFVLLGGAGAFYYFEHWDFVDAFYYCFITMSTIGFGDFVALQNSTMLALQTRPEYVAFSILYILFGLTIFAAALNLMVLRLLTMNTEDERKDELEALAAARGAVKLDGDVITPGINNTAMSSFVGEEEGMQLEVDDYNNEPLFVQQYNKKSQPYLFQNTNGFLHSSKHKPTNVSRVGGVITTSLSKQNFINGRGVLSPSNSRDTQQVLVNEDPEEGPADVETVFSSSVHYHNKKRCSV